jgi:hypothetical protein
MNRKLMWAVLVIGLALVIAPFAIGLPGKSAAGQRMLNGFHPLMQRAAVQTTASYYNNVFTPLGTVSTQFTAAASNPQMQTQLAPLMPILQPVMPIFKQVPAGLRWYGPLVHTMQANVTNYQQVNSLPDFRLFTWFFVLPGALLILLAGYGLIGNPFARGFSFGHGVRPTAA